MNNTGPRPVRTGALPATAARVLELLQSRREQMSVVALGEELQLHTNTVRETLQLLVARHLVRRDRAPGNGRGRPAWLYSADPTRREPDRRVHEHSVLAGVLAARISETSAEPGVEGRAAGRVWGAALATGRTDEPRAAVVEVLEDLDFSPRDDGSAILLRTCPLLDVAQETPEVVCAVHEGMVSGLLENMGAPHDVTLLPFAAPDGCVLRLKRPPESP